MNRTALLQLVMRHEGEVLSPDKTRQLPYVDTAGKITIGWGRNLTDVGISIQEGLMLLGHDLDSVEADLATFAWYPLMDEVRQRALCDMRFNLGPGGFRLFTHMIHALAVGDYATAAQEMRASQWAKQVGTRADELAQMMENG